MISEPFCSNVYSKIAYLFDVYCNNVVLKYTYLEMEKDFYKTYFRSKFYEKCMKTLTFSKNMKSPTRNFSFFDRTVSKNE